MTKALSNAKDGVALAAPQVGIPLRIFIVLKEYMENKTAKELKEIQEKKKNAQTSKGGDSRFHKPENHKNF